MDVHRKHHGISNVREAMSPLLPLTEGLVFVDIDAGMHPMCSSQGFAVLLTCSAVSD
jgi:hypothetical protein